MVIKDFLIREIFDSRGQSTVEVGISTKDGLAFYSSVPSGKSRGSKEAAVLDFKSASSIKNIKKLSAVKGQNFASVKSFDDFLLKLDGTKNKKALGGNVMLGFSMSFARAKAFEAGEELSEFLHKEFFKDIPLKKEWSPVIFSNLINGGEHAENNLNIQEYMVLVDTSKGVKNSVKKLIYFYDSLGDLLKKKFRIPGILPIGDEGGYSLDFKDNFEPMVVLSDLIKKNGLAGSFRLGLDAAASSFYSGNRYIFGGRKLTTEKLADTYLSAFKKFPMLYSIEDPFSESDPEGFCSVLSRVKGNMLVGDDLTVTNSFLVEKYASIGAINGVIIKPNQAGTVSEAASAILSARLRGVKTVISHRSGETEDVFIISLGKASDSYGLKIGSPTRERMLKFNELLRI